MAKKISKSWTIHWGTVQTIAGILAAGLAAYNPVLFPGIPLWIYGTLLVVSGIITYVLRLKTTQPLDTPLSATPPDNQG